MIKSETKSVAEAAMESFIVALCDTEIQLFKDRETWKKEDA